jgi:Rod binding domain-containing protein
MDMQHLPGADPLRLESRALENKLRKLRDGAGSDSAELTEGRLRQVSRDIEAIFVKILLDTMQKSVPQSGLFEKSSGMETWKGMFNEKLSENLSSQETIGLADMIYNQLSTDLNRHKDVPLPAEWIPAGGVQHGRRVLSGAPAAPEIEPAPAAEPASGPLGPLPAQVERFRGLIEDSASRYGLEPALVAAVITQESAGKPEAVSPVGAQGLMQLMPHTADSLGVSDPFDPRENIDGGCRYLRDMLNLFEGEEKVALAAYNAGPTAVRRYGGVPPYPETQKYVSRVSQLKNNFACETQ